ncbi:calcium-binding protein LPS1-alpha-like [Tubulanus polymorphus]|uniref:calcium-binding protein LPS1-alpha-like n=1 Tax=Tubulanus polymorphus TaxID=672921 RepID=UPI003DA42D03
MPTNKEIIDAIDSKKKMNPSDRKRCEGLLSLFDKTDTDGSGSLSVGECEAMFGNKATGKAYFESLDLDQKDGISKKEFLEVIVFHDDETKYKQMFNKCDKDDDNKLTLEEMKEFLGKLNGSQETTDSVQRLVMDHFDANKDGTLDFEEFKTFMKMSVSGKAGQKRN